MMNAAAVATISQPTTPTREQCMYTACYCEENTYMLVKSLIQQHGRHPTQVFAVFISNSNETVPFWYHRASTQPDGLVVWDYHVIVLEVPLSSPALVWDLDLHHPDLPFPCSLQDYATHALQIQQWQPPQHLSRWMRLVPGPALLQHFASDRSHMRRPDGSWAAAPPQYACITAQDGCSTMNLGRYRDMAQDVLQVGRQVRLDQRPRPHVQQQLQELEGCIHEAAGQHADCTMPVGDGSSCHGERGSRGDGAGLEADASGVAEAPREELTWAAIVQAAGSSKYGVVVDERTLLHCLLQPQDN